MMYQGRPRTLFARFAIPQMIGLLFNSVYLIVDGVFIGNRLGRDAMAAAAVSVPFIEILIALSMAVASGAGIVVSGHLGRGEDDEARRQFNLSVAVLLAMLPLIFGSEVIWICHSLSEVTTAAVAIAMLGITRQASTVRRHSRGTGAVDVEDALRSRSSDHL